MDQAGHAPYDRGSFILDDDFAAPRANALRPIYAIRAHPGHDDSQNIRSVDLGDGTKQHIDRGPAGIFRRIPIQVHPRTVGRAFQRHVKISGCDPGLSEMRCNSRASFLNVNFRVRIEPFRQETRKDWRHVLHQHDGDGKILGKPRQNFRERIRTSGGGANGYDLNTPMGRPPYRYRRTGRRRGGKLGERPGAQGLDLRNQLGANGRDRLRSTARVAGFGSVVGRPKR